MSVGCCNTVIAGVIRHFTCLDLRLTHLTVDGWLLIPPLQEMVMYPFDGHHELVTG